MISISIIAISSYLLGSIPFGYILMRIFRGQDVRESGSGNIGATNVARSSSFLGAATLLLDALKGLAAVAAVSAIFPGQTLFPAIAALSAVLGHMFPVWLGFHGGKGVATGLGSFVLLAPKTMLLATGIFIAVVILFRYVSLGSMLAVASFPLLVVLLYRGQQNSYVLILMATTSILIIFKHRENIRRLFAGTESRFQWSRAR